MKIIYGVSGEGLGHVFEALELIPLLEQNGHAVKVFTYGNRPLSFLKPFHPTQIEGIRFYFGPHGLSIIKTVYKNLNIIPFYFKNWKRLRKEIEEFNPDVFISSFEPFTTFSSHVFHKPLISLSNQKDLLYVKRPSEIKLFDFKLLNLVTRICTYGTTYFITRTFIKKPPVDNVVFVAPFVQKETMMYQPTISDHTLVYLNKPNPDLLNILKDIPENFIVYCNNQVGTEKNITFKASGGESYMKDLSSCKAIIGTTGFSLIGDALYLKKPYFGIPLKGQPEQMYNALTIKQLGIGEYTKQVTSLELNNFFAHLSIYREALEKYEYDPQEEERVVLTTLRKISRT